MFRVGFSQVHAFVHDIKSFSTTLFVFEGSPFDVIRNPHLPISACYRTKDEISKTALSAMISLLYRFMVSNTRVTNGEILEA